MADLFEFDKKLHFSWGHILSFLALIAIAYCTFVGSVYLINGRFLLAGFITLGIIVVLAVWFLTAQQLKCTSRRFAKRIKIERFIVFSSPFVFLLLMLPFYHSWTVHQRQNEMADLFEKATGNVVTMYNEYQEYAENRINNYVATLAQGSYSALESKNRQETLRLILLSSNYDTLKTSSIQWIDKSTQGKVSTWNIFLLGNIKEIENAVNNWHSDLQTFSKVRLSDEPNTYYFDEQSVFAQTSSDYFNKLRNCYKRIRGCNPISILLLIIGYLLLLLPYIIQNRNSKTVGQSYTLFGFLHNNNEEPSDSDSIFELDDTTSSTPTEDNNSSNDLDPFIF